MASLSLLQSTVSSFPGRSLLLSAPHSVRAPRNVVMAPVRAEADTIVLVDKADNEKVDRLKTNYLEKIVPLLMEEFKYENIHQVPKVTKIVVNCGMGEAASNSKGLEAAINDLATITGQRPVKTIARNSVAAFKIREGQTLGIAVTLRRDIMYAFLDRLINLGLPRSRDFQGVSPYSFDGHGNYSLGLSDQGVFPDLKFSLQGRNQGMDVCISTTAKNDKEGHKLLSLMGMPFKAGVVDSGVGEPRKKKLKAHHFSTKGAGRSRR